MLKRTQRTPSYRLHKPSSRAVVTLNGRDWYLGPYRSRANPENRHQRKATWTEKRNPNGRWRAYDYFEIIKRDKVSLDIFWLKDESLEDSANLPDPDVIAEEIVEDLQAALDQFATISADLRAE